MRGRRIGPFANTAVHGGSTGIWSLQEVQQLKGANLWNTPKAVSVPGTIDNPASSASAIKSANPSATNGAYYYTVSSGTVQLWTDFTTYSSLSPFVLVTRLSAADHLQYLTTSNNPGDLTVASTTAPSRSAKLSDTDMNYIIVANTIRWVTVAQYATFYRMNDSWTSNFGSSGSCGYTTAYYQDFSTPSNTPSWTNFTSYAGACGAGQYNGEWLTLSGIHTNDSNYTGGYTGSSGLRGSTPAAYSISGYSNGQWNVPGYVFLSW